MYITTTVQYITTICKLSTDVVKHEKRRYVCHFPFTYSFLFADFTWPSSSLRLNVFRWFPYGVPTRACLDKLPPKLVHMEISYSDFTSVRQYFTWHGQTCLGEMPHAFQVKSCLICFKSFMHEDKNDKENPSPFFRARPIGSIFRYWREFLWFTWIP